MKKPITALLVLAAVAGVGILVAGASPADDASQAAAAPAAAGAPAATEVRPAAADTAHPVAESPEASGEALTRVEPIKVCMVNDEIFEKDQIPVEVAGRTYYGCCQMCKGRLAEDAEVRRSTDPVTGATVDKATAVIAARPDGSVLYFASEETLARYRDGERAR